MMCKKKKKRYKQYYKITFPLLLKCATSKSAHVQSAKGYFHALLPSCYDCTNSTFACLAWQSILVKTSWKSRTGLKICCFCSLSEFTHLRLILEEEFTLKFCHYLLIIMSSFRAFFFTEEESSSITILYTIVVNSSHIYQILLTNSRQSVASIHFGLVWGRQIKAQYWEIIRWVIWKYRKAPVALCLKLFNWVFKLFLCNPKD